MLNLTYLLVFLRRKRRMDGECVSFTPTCKMRIISCYFTNSIIAGLSFFLGFFFFFLTTSDDHFASEYQTIQIVSWKPKITLSIKKVGAVHTDEFYEGRPLEDSSIRSRYYWMVQRSNISFISSCLWREEVNTLHTAFSIFSSKQHRVRSEFCKQGYYVNWVIP